MREIYFVTWQEPGQPTDQGDDPMIRQHVRKAVLRDRGYRNIHNRIRQFTGTRFVTAAVVSDSRATPGAIPMLKPAPNSDEKRQQLSSRIAKPPLHPFDLDHRHNAFRYLASSMPRVRPFTTHPYTPYAASVVPVPAERIDFLFRSHFFRNAAEPLFDASHVDSTFRMDLVFPGCLTSPAFLNALLYSMVQTANKGTATTEGLRLLGRALQSLSVSISTEGLLRHPEVGSIMILQGVAYRWNDVTSHEAHTKGLIRSLQGVKEPCLTTMGAKALFWQDLFAALLINSTRYQSHLAPPHFQWRREVRPSLPSVVPIGVLAQREVLSDELLRCIEDIIELQDTVSTMKTSSIILDVLGRMQASIESRLTFAAPRCQEIGPVAECSRIAALIICFLSWTEIWANALIPCKLSELLGARLHESITCLDWFGRRNLQVWLLLTGSTVAILNRGCVDSVDQRWNDLLTAFRLHYSCSQKDEMEGIDMNSVLNDFIYCHTLVQQRCSMPAWREFELGLTAE